MTLSFARPLGARLTALLTTLSLTGCIAASPDDGTDLSAGARPEQFASTGDPDVCTLQKLSVAAYSSPGADVIAPGEAPVGVGFRGSVYSEEGTSIAAPTVAAVAWRLAQRFDLSPAQLREVLTRTSKLPANPARAGAGLIQPAAAFTEAQNLAPR